MDAEQGDARAIRPPLMDPGAFVTATADLEPLLTRPSGLSKDELTRRWELVLPHAERLRRIAIRRLASPDEADDVVQEAMLRAVTFEQLDADYAGQFLTAVTVRLCADVHRDRDRQLRVGVRDAVRAVPHCDPHDELLDTAEARWLYDECLKLPRRERAVVFARARGMSVRDAAVTLGVGVKSAEAALTKARHRMRRVVQAAGAVIFAFLGRMRRVGTPALVTTSMSVLFVGGVMQSALPNAAAPLHAHEAPLRKVVGVAVDRPETTASAVRAATVRPAAGPADPEPQQQPPARTGPVHTRPNQTNDPAMAGNNRGFSVDRSGKDLTTLQDLTKCLQAGVAVAPAGCVTP